MKAILLLLFFLLHQHIIFSQTSLSRQDFKSLIEQRKNRRPSNEGQSIQFSQTSQKEEARPKKNTQQSKKKPAKLPTKSTSLASQDQAKTPSENSKKIYLGTSFVAPVGTFQKDKKIIPVTAKIIVTLKEDISNMNYSQPALFIVTSPDYLKGWIAVGQFRVLKQDKGRIYIDFTSIMNDKGDEFKVDGYAVDLHDEQPGIKGTVDQKVGANILKIIGETATTVLAVATDELSHGVVGKIMAQTTTKQINQLETESLVTAQKNTRAFLKLSKNLVMSK